MPIKGKLIKNYFSLLDSYNKKSQDFNVKVKKQEATLKKLLTKAKSTEFGKAYNFEQAINDNDMIAVFQKNVPVFNYESMYEKWWTRTIKGEPNISWPGKIKYLALTSGTSIGATKRIPVSDEMIKDIRKTGFKHLCATAKFNLPPSFYEKDVLALGGSIMLKQFQALKEGDLSGILAANLPSWMGNVYLPGNEIAKETDWEQKIKKIVKEAPKWDVAIIAGVPAWVLLLIKEILAEYNLKSIHDIWPNFRIYAHGGVSIQPYLSSFDKVITKELHFSETYLASEGFFAYQPNVTNGMELTPDGGIFFEFLPFNDQYFDIDGNVKDYSGAISIKDVQENIDYALLISTRAGAWRYMIGDVIRFINKERAEIQIVGRTKHFVNLCGEHLSIDNLNDAIKELNRSLKTNTHEFSVYPFKAIDGIYHKWVITSDKFVDEEQVKTIVDNKLKETNDDYRTVRHHSIKDIEYYIIPNQKAYDWMASRGKNGGQNKFPRVFTKELFDSITEYLELSKPEDCKKLFD